MSEYLYLLFVIFGGWLEVEDGLRWFEYIPLEHTPSPENNSPNDLGILRPFSSGKGHAGSVGINVKQQQQQKWWICPEMWN